MTPAPLPEEDHHCESCGLRYGDLTPSAALRLIRSYPAQYRHRLQHLPAGLLRRRPAAGVWSPLEVAIICAGRPASHPDSPHADRARARA
jgi:hypothetical protein